MQKTIILSGTTSRNYGPKTIADAINSVLENNPDFRMVNAIILENSKIFCKLLCVFETHVGDLKHPDDWKRSDEQMDKSDAESTGR